MSAPTITRPRVHVREAEPSDNEALKAIAAACPMTGDLTIGLTREPDFFQLNRLEGSRWHVGIAEVDDEIVGCAMVAERTSYLHGGEHTTLYAGDLKVHPSARGAGVADALCQWGRDLMGEMAGYEVHDLRRRWRLGFDIDSPLDLLLLGRRPWLPASPGGVVDRVAERLAAVRAVAHDPHAELLVAGRMSAGGLGWLERSVPARVRALVEERGLRTATADQRRPRSVLGLVTSRSTGTDEERLDDGASDLGAVLAELGDAALVDSRVLIAHQVGADQSLGPGPEDRFASDLLLHERIADEWLRALTRSAATARIPIVLGGHSLVGPGLRLALGVGRS